MHPQNPQMMMNPLAGALGQLSNIAGLSGIVTDLAKAPVQRWNQASGTHKIISVAAGAGIAYYLHSRGMANAAVAVAGVGAAYATSMIMHFPSVRQTPTTGQGGATAGALPPGQMEAMNQQAQAVMGMGRSSAPQGGSIAPAAAPTVSAGAQNIPAARSGRWDVLDAEM